ncbi:MAG: hypothetical protein IKP21_04280 [Bacteroidales bacterium]|nr:hypothetical protein [Bacteroidales bacterium]
MKTLRLFTLLAFMASLSACEKPSVAPEVTHNPLKSTVWEASWYETPGGEFDLYTDRLLFKTDTTGEIVSIVSTVYYYGDNPGTLWDTIVAMTYKLDTVNKELYVYSDYSGNPSHLKYSLEDETMTVVGNEQVVYVRVM